MSASDDSFECSKCQEWYKATLKKCPFCGEKNKGREHITNGDKCWCCPYKDEDTGVNIAAASLGSLGGKASAKSLTPEQRSERAKKAVKAREAKRNSVHTLKD